MEPRTHVSSGAPWESRVGYSRAVRVGGRILVSGTVAFDPDGRIVGPDDAYLQTKQIIKTIKNALEQVDSSLAQVVRTRIYVTRIRDWPDVGRAHAEAFKDVRPATSMVEVRKLIDPACLVEIEAEAVD